MRQPLPNKIWNGQVINLQILTLCICLLIGNVAHVQAFQSQSANTITGQVNDAQGLYIPGVNILVKGTTTATVSDLDGKFRINASPTDILIFSFIGYTTVEMVVGNQTQLSIVLDEDQTQLDEVVVVGYGTQKKSHLTGAVSKFENTNLGDLPILQADQALQGKIAGVQIQNTTSEAGVSPSIRIRGNSSIGANNEPLVVVDGFPTPDGLSFINPNDIESIEVLKDAASAAIYGSRGANGVIIVTTKSGVADKPTFTFKMFSGVKSPYKLHDMLTSKEYAEMLWEEETRGGAAPTIHEQAAWSVENETNWQEEGLRQGVVSSYQLGVSGGKKDITYLISGGYNDEKGMLINNDFERLNLRMKMDAKLNKVLKVGVNINPSYTKRILPASNFTDYFRTPSFMPVRHNEETSALTGIPVGEYAHGRHFSNVLYEFTTPQGIDVSTTSARPWSTSNNNPKFISDNDSRVDNQYRLLASTYLQIDLGKNLFFKASQGAYITNRVQEEYRNEGTNRAGDPNRGSYETNLRIDLLSENILSYNKSFGDHEVSAVGGFTAQKVTNTYSSIVGTNFPTDYVPTLNGATVIDLVNTYTLKDETLLLSYLARASYSYKNKYLFSASARTDGSSLFGPDNKWGWFPSVSAGWVLSEEGFLQGNSVIDLLKLRASYGVTGNNDIENYASVNRLYPENYAFGAGTGTLTPGLAQSGSTLANRSIAWERTFSTNIGFDIAFLENRFSLSAEYYQSQTDQLLLRQPTLAITGFTEFWNNIGKIQNNGFEFEMNLNNVNKKNFQWSTSLNLSSVKNKLVEFSGEDRLLSYGERNEIYLAQVGQPYIQFFGYKAIGVWNSQEEINANASNSLDRPGGLRLLDANEDGIIDDDDRVVLGNPFPDFTWGITNNFNFGNFDLSVLIQGVQGIDVFNGDGHYNETKRTNRKYVENRWVSAESPGDGVTPYSTNGIGWQFTDYMIEDGSYVSVRDIVLGYNFPQSITEKIKLKGLRVYGSAQNALYFSAKGYRGINPEARSTSSQYASPLVTGYQRGSFPVPRAFVFGIDVSF
ncbi:SusC/RagA family TonB-linked outer membrane protein [Algoriphagus winogradskyi]|uniref:TonB-linked outer membrane protein, SusC/RagA family n=1 Tax=Algoriphagus winogradskyi TaxID=237017 RepID=A0ABY1P674_9BACT|nr:TonB-dependent receptor [Algoriphagus winogradskyi]SMP27276.1 TonB-linked outer membrane protein, SusC/RagA family [Algoriphagus winogradskyi]